MRGKRGKALEKKYCWSLGLSEGAIVCSVIQLKLDEDKPQLPKIYLRLGTYP